jgi:hypothetical protein
MIADLELSQLQCNKQSDGSGGCNPYLWVVLLRIDDDTLGGNPPAAAVFPQDPAAPRIVVEAGMKAGDTAVVPDQVDSLVTDIRTDSVQRNLILIAALLDQHDTSWAAMAAGYQAFVTTAPVAVGAQLLQLQDAALYEQAIQAITSQISNQVKSAIEAQLSWWDKVQIALHLETPDRIIGTAYQDWQSVAASSSGSYPLEITSTSGDIVTDDFVLGCQLAVTVDPCEDQVAAVQGIQQAIANIEGLTKQLTSGQVHEPPAQVETELNQLAAEMIKEREKLAAAEAALDDCRKGVVTRGPGESALNA